MESAVFTEKKQSTLQAKKWHIWPIIKRLFAQSTAVVLIVLFWEFAPRLGVINAQYLPPFSEVLKAGWQMVVTGELWLHLSASLTRSLSGFTLAVVVGIPLGLLLGWYALVRDLFNPIFEIYRNTSSLALLPLFILFLGIGEESKIAIVFYACAAEVILQTVAGMKSVDPMLVKAARSMNFSAPKIFWKVILPAATPVIFVGIKFAATGSILMLLVAEMIGANSGLGYLIISSQYNFLVEKMFAGILMVTSLGLFVNFLLNQVEKRLLKWKK